MDIRISAVIPTHNRAGYLRKALEALANQTLPKREYEILVIDNRSLDHTKQVVLEEFSGLQNLKYIFEPVLGLNQARNTGWRYARGRYVAYTDDDAIPCQVWLQRIVEAFETVLPMPGCVGGRIDPIWETPRPLWLADDIALSLTILNWSDTPVILNNEQWLAGANIAFPKHLLELVNGFQVGLDRTGNSLLSNGEVLTVKYLEQQGYGALYHPGIAVRHHVLASRLTKSWFLRRWYWQGVSDAITQVHLESLSVFRRLRIATAIVKDLVGVPIYLAKLLMPTDDPHRFAQTCVTLRKVGKFLGFLAIPK